MQQQVTTRLATEVLIVGDGLTALVAAVEARKAGKRVLLAAAETVVAAEITAALCGQVGATNSAPLQTLIDAVAAAGGRLGDWLDPTVTEIVLDRLLDDQGIDLLLYAIPLALVPDASSERAAGVLMGGKDGGYIIAAGAVIDATADGALFRQSGVPFRQPDALTAQRTVFFEFADDGPLDGVDAEVEGFHLALRRTWPDQACLTMTGTATDLAALDTASRLALPAVTAYAIAQAPALHRALACLTGHRLLPLNGPVMATPCPQHPRYANVFAAGPWIAGDGWGKLNVLACLGEAPAHRAVEAVEAPQSVTARLPAPVVVETDVLVVGGGTGGAIAALAAGRRGVATTLLESGACLGGIGTVGGIHDYYHGVRGGLQDEVDTVMAKVLPSLGDPERVLSFHPEAKKVALVRMANEAGVAVITHTTAMGVEMDGSRITGVLAATPGQLTLYRAKVVVDGTGDADVAAFAGAEFAYGRAADGMANTYSLVPGTREHGRYAWANFDAGLVDATDVFDLTRARRHGLRLLARPAPFTPEDRYTAISPLLGLRQSRQIITDYVLTLDDQVAGRRFPDAIAYGCCHHDNHKLDFQNESAEAAFWVWVLGFWDRWLRHDVPYRCLLPRGIEGLLIACRAAGMTTDVSVSLRTQRDMQRLGDAAGTAAALAVRQGVTPRQLPLDDLLTALRAQGVLREGQPIRDAAEEKPGDNAMWVNDLYDDDPPADSLPSVAEISRRLGRAWGSVLAWQLYQWGDAAMPALREVLATGGPHARWWAAAVLAMREETDGAMLLLASLQAREPGDAIPPGCPEWHNGWRTHAAPRWLAAAVLLGKARYQPALAPLCALLNEPGHEPNVYSAVLRALLHIGDPSAVPAIQAFLQHPDLPEEEICRFASHTWLPTPVRHDVAWKLRLIAAEALTALAAPDPTIAQPYLDHPNACVRHYARRVYEEANTALATV